MVLVNIRYFFIYILQATNRFKEYSMIIMIDRIVYVIFISTPIIFHNLDYQLLIYAELFSMAVSLGLSIVICRDIALQSYKNFTLNISEVYLNVKAGIQVMFANTAGMLIIGVIRLGIERTWDIATFGKISLTMSVSKFMMIFINAMGIVMFPMLRRTKFEKLSNIYITLNQFYSVIILAVLVLYYPIKEFLLLWLPEYTDSLIYMALLFPMSVYEGKMSLIINPYLKTLRKESMLLKINLIGLLLGGIASILSTFLLKNLYFAVISIVLVLSIRTIISEIVLSKILNVKYFKNIILESSFVILFIALGLLKKTWISMIIYIFIYLIYLCYNKEILKEFRILLKINKG